MRASRALTSRCGRGCNRYDAKISLSGFREPLESKPPAMGIRESIASAGVIAALGIAKCVVVEVVAVVVWVKR